MLERAQALLKEHFGYTAFKPGQEKVISSLLAGGDTLAIMPTGAGKSVCYQVPALIFGGVTLVISPLIALMKDQVDGMTASGIPATFINSSLRSAEVGRRLEQAGQERFKLVYVAPERLEIAEFQALAAALDISFVAIDEAHCVSQWGHDFRPSYRKIGLLPGAGPDLWRDNPGHFPVNRTDEGPGRRHDRLGHTGHLYQQFATQCRGGAQA